MRRFLYTYKSINKNSNCNILFKHLHLKYMYCKSVVSIQLLLLILGSIDGNILSAHTYFKSL